MLNKGILGGLLGSSTRRKLAGGAPFDFSFPNEPSGGSLVATPQQEAETRRLESIYGTDPRSSTGPILQDIGQANPPQISDADRERQAVLGMLGSAPQKPKSNWARDYLAPVLATVGDALSESSGRHGGYSALDTLMKQQAEGRQRLSDAQTAYERSMRIANLPGMNQREFAAFQMDPKAWGGSMSRAATSRYEAATLNPGDVRTYGDGQGSIQAPTRAAQYATDLDLTPGTDAYHNAVRDQELGANGPSAFNNDVFLTNARNLAASRLERQRQTGRMGLEGVRQDNRMEVRNAPTYRDTHGAPPRGNTPPAGAPRVKTAKDANGNTAYLRDGKWVDAQGRPIQ